MSDERLSLALVGCGDIAAAYLEGATQSRRCRIVQVMDINRTLAEERGKAAGVPATDRFEDVLANPEAEAVILSVPHFLHAPMAIQALERGKHVMCDKPIATNVADGQRMIDTAARLGRRLTVNYPMRSSDRARFAKQLLKEGLIGDVLGMTIVTAMAKPDVYWSQGWSHVTSTDWRGSKAKAGGGVTLMNVSHYLDLLFGITGLGVTEVHGRAGTFNSPPGIEVEDLAAGVGRLSNGGILSVLASSCYLGGLPHQMSILGKKGQIDMVGGKESILRVFLSDAGGRDIKPFEWVELPVPVSGLSVGYAGLLDGFAAAVRDGAPVPVEPRDALHTLACVLGIYGEESQLPPGYDRL